jgi:hypothetical protein
MRRPVRRSIASIIIVELLDLAPKRRACVYHSQYALRAIIPDFALFFSSHTVPALTLILDCQLYS